MLVSGCHGLLASRAKPDGRFTVASGEGDAVGRARGTRLVEPGGPQVEAQRRLLRGPLERRGPRPPDDRTEPAPEGAVVHLALSPSETAKSPGAKKNATRGRRSSPSATGGRSWTKELSAPHVRKARKKIHAERVGFEPTDRSSKNDRLIINQVPSATRPPLHALLLLVRLA